MSAHFFPSRALLHTHKHWMLVRKIKTRLLFYFSHFVRCCLVLCDRPRSCTKLAMRSKREPNGAHSKPIHLTSQTTLYRLDFSPKEIDRRFEKRRLNVNATLAIARCRPSCFSLEQQCEIRSNGISNISSHIGSLCVWSFWMRCNLSQLSFELSYF